jgi:hypothetical protein
VDAQAIEKVLHMCSGIEKTYNSYIILENGSQLLVAKQDGTYFDMWSKCWKYFEACLTYIANTFKCA